MLTCPKVTQNKNEEMETPNMDSAEKRRPLGSGVAIC